MHVKLSPRLLLTDPLRRRMSASPRYFVVHGFLAVKKTPREIVRDLPILTLERIRRSRVTGVITEIRSLSRATKRLIARY